MSKGSKGTYQKKLAHIKEDEDSVRVKELAMYDQFLKQPSDQSQIMFLSGSQQPCETEISREIKACSEVEKIWIIFDVDKSGKLEYDEVNQYLQIMAYPSLKLSEEQTKAIFDEIDRDKSGSIDKKEME